MAKNSITDYSKTAASNTDIQSVDIDEGCLPSGINNAIRELMADLADMNDGTVTLTSPSFAAASLTGDLSFGDNDKAIFGAGSDLQIYHDGSDSYIRDSGSGDLYIEGSDDIRFRTTSGETYAVFNENSSVNLYYDNALKFATSSTGIDVTGTVTADGLTVDGVGSLTSSSTELLDLTSTGGDSLIRFGSLNSSFDVRIGSPSNPSTANGSFVVRTAGDDRLLVANNGDISFYEDTGTTAKFFWDASAESLGIGTSSPQKLLEIASGNSGGDAALDSPTFRIKNTTESADWDAEDVVGTIEYYSTDASGNSPYVTSFIKSVNEQGNGTLPSGALTFGTTTYNASGGAVERLRIDSSGNVGIGTTSPAKDLHIVGGDFSGLRIVHETDGTTFNLQSDSSGNTQLNATTATDITFLTTNFERMRIDSSGNVLVGTTDALPATNNDIHGIALRADGNLMTSRSGSVTARFNRGSSDGDIVAFHKDGTTVGSIGVDYGSRLYIGTGDTGLFFNDLSDAVQPISPAGDLRGNAIDLGTAGTTFKDLYLGGGVYLGGTGSANKLDDYEEGTFTPVFRDNTSGGNTATATVANGVYTKIGRLVHVDIYFVNINTSGMTSGNAAYITNLPFTSLSGNNFSTGFPRIDQVIVDDVGIAAEVAQGQTYIRLKQIISGAEDENVIVGDFVSGYADFFLGLTYTTNT
jgi:hypothetical protein